MVTNDLFVQTIQENAAQDHQGAAGADLCMSLSDSFCSRSRVRACHLLYRGLLDACGAYW